MKRLQLNSSDLYNVWKGQLYIQEHLACDIKFKSPSTCCIPAQLPSKLEIKEVIRLSELREVLPLQFFDQINITGQEERCGSVYYTLYPAQTSNVNGSEPDWLLHWMRDHKLALIKTLHDRGFLILLTSSALQCCKDRSVKDSFQLFALFLFPHTKLLASTGTEDSSSGFVQEDISLEITELLPGLQYAILETRQMRKGEDCYPDVLVEQHFKQFTGLQRKNVRLGEVTAELSDPSPLSPGHGKDIPRHRDPTLLSCLQSYFSSPVNFSVPLVKMSSLLKEDVPLSSDSEKCGKNMLGGKDAVALESKIPLLAANKMKSDSSGGNSVLNENKKQPAKKRSFKRGGRRGTRKGRRKHTHQAALSAAATSENQVASKKRKMIGEVQQQPPPQQQQAVSSNRTTVKLASAPNSHRRKRGAEVLTAEFVNYDKVSDTETTTTGNGNKEQPAVIKNKIVAGKPRKAASADDTPVVRDRPPKRKASDPGYKSKLLEAKAKSEIPKGAIKRQTEQSGRQLRKPMASVSSDPSEPVSSFGKSSKDHTSPAKPSTHSAPVPEKEIMEKRINMYESHALNLLADLALNSFSSSSISYMNSESAEPKSDPISQEKVADGDDAIDDAKSDSGETPQSNTAPEEPVQSPDGAKSQPKVGSDGGQTNSTTPNRTENGEKLTSHKMLIAAAKAKARNNATSKISLEHSYSQLPTDDVLDKSSKEANEKPTQSVSEPPATSPGNEVVEEQSPDLLFSKEHLLVTGDNGVLSLNKEPREVSKSRDNFVITFKWEPKYNFELDSKFTSDPLEKTINRALHGPWNTHLKEKVEDVKIILHMWLALFYSKPSQQLTSSSRKVVEHSNPAKYVSINTVHDPLYEIAETDPADTEDGKESGPARPGITAGASPAWHGMEDRGSSQPMDLTVAPRMQTKGYPRESEHKYSKLFSSSEDEEEEEAQRSSGSENDFSMLRDDLSALKDMPVSPEPLSPTKRESFSLEDDRLPPLTCDDNQKATGGRGVPAQKIPSSTADHTESSPSKASGINRGADVLRDDDGCPDHSHANRNVMSWKQIIREKYKQQETVLGSEDSRDLLGAKLQDVHMDKSKEDEEPDAPHGHVTRRSSGGALGNGEGNNHNINDLKSSLFGESQTDVKLCNNENLSPLASLNYDSHAAALEVGKPLESGKPLSDDNRPTLESPKAVRISLELPHSEKSALRGDGRDQPASKKDLLIENNTEGESPADAELSDREDSGVDLEPAANHLEEDKVIFSINEESLGKRSEKPADMLEGCPKEPPKSDTQEIAPFGKMGKLVLSSSSSETSDVEDMDADNAGKSGPGSQKTDQDKSHGNEIPDGVEPPASVHQDDGRSPKDDGRHVHGDTAHLQTTDHGNEVDGTVKTKEDLPTRSQSPPTCVLGVDQVDSPPADGRIGPPDQEFRPLISEISEEDTYFGEKSSVLGSESSKTSYLDAIGKKSLLIGSLSSKAADVETIGEQSSLLGPEASKTSDLEAIGEKSLLLGFEVNKASDLEAIGDKSSLLGSKPSKHSDLEAIGEKSSLLGSKPSNASDLEAIGEKSSLFGAESSKASDLEAIGEKSSLLGSEASKASDVEAIGAPLPTLESGKASEDLECISVFEKLSLKADKEMYTTQISTLADKEELETPDVESIPAEIETVDDNPTVELLGKTGLSGSSVLDTEDHMIANEMEEGNSCEILQVPSSEALNKVPPANTLVEKSAESTPDPDDVTDQPPSRCVNVDLVPLPVESQSDSTSDDVIMTISPVQPKKSPKDQSLSMRNTIRNEILSKLKRICRGTGIGQQASSNSEDEVFIVHEKPGKLQVEEQTKPTDNEIVDLATQEINTVDLDESIDKTEEDQTPKLGVLQETMEQEMAEDIPSITSADPIVPQEAEEVVPPDKPKSPIHDDFTDHMDQDTGQEQSEICCILNTSSISKEQYDRWSETSDDDIEFVRSYKEPLQHKTIQRFQKECRELFGSPAEEPTAHHEQSHSRKAKRPKRHSGPSTSQREADDHVSRYHRDTEYPSPKSHGNFIITKKMKDIGRAWPTVHKDRFSAGRSDHDTLVTNRRVVSSDLTQNTLDMERLRFMCRLKDVLRKSSTDVRVSEPPFQSIFDSRRIAGCSRSRAKCISPLLVTFHCKHRRRDHRGHDVSFPSSSYSQAYYEDEPREKPAYYSRTPKKVRKRRCSPPYHFSRLRYESALEKPNSDISVIIKECTQSNHLKLSRVGLASSAMERTSACSVPEDSDRQRRTFDPASTKSQTVGNIITDLCTNLRSKLHSVARESAQRNCYFYLSETVGDQEEGGDDFFSLTKSLLIKDGYTPMDPKEFCDGERAESDQLLVIIRNENVSAHIHKIPHLLRLRLLPNVRFAGVDTPEDLSESMHQELLQAGGFVVSDKAVLENIALGKLKEVLTILEKMNRTSAWKWLVHYGDYRKLKEDKRPESVSRIKIPLLKSYQQSNVIEILPYHRCDSRTGDPASDLECLLSLQSQHIRSRLAVLLTVTPSADAGELEQNGVLVYDVDTFIRRIQKVDAQLQPTLWS